MNADLTVRFCFKSSILQTLFKGKWVSQVIFKGKYGQQRGEWRVSLGPKRWFTGTEPPRLTAPHLFKVTSLARTSGPTVPPPERAHRWNWTDGRRCLHPHTRERRRLDTCSFNRSPHIWNVSVKRPCLRNTDAHVPGRVTGELAPMPFQSWCRLLCFRGAVGVLVRPRYS